MCYWESKNSCQKEFCEFKHQDPRKDEWKINEAQSSDQRGYMKEVIDPSYDEGRYMNKQYSSRVRDVGKHSPAEHDEGVREDGAIVYEDGIAMFRMYNKKKCIINDIDFRWNVDTKQQKTRRPLTDDDQSEEIIYQDGVPMFKMYRGKNA